MLSDMHTIDTRQMTEEVHWPTAGGDDTTGPSSKYVKKFWVFGYTEHVAES